MEARSFFIASILRQVPASLDRTARRIVSQFKLWRKLQVRLQPWRSAAVFVFAGTTFCAAAVASPDAFKDVRSDGGLVPGARVFAVTSLSDSGPGTLRAAIEARGPRVIIFAVSGLIELAADLTIETGPVTIAGETAPAPGIIIHNGTVKIRTQNVVLSHIAVYPGPSADPKIADNRDAIDFFGSPSRHNILSGIVLRNISVGWAVDENIGVQGLTDGLRIERALIAQPLRYGGHSKGAHSMNLLLGNPVGRVVVVGSVLAASDQRSPRLTQGNRVSFLNNLIFGPGGVGTHVDTSKETLNPGAIDIIGNVYIPNRNTRCQQPMIRVSPDFGNVSPATPLHLADNIVEGPMRDCLLVEQVDASFLAPQPSTAVESWSLVPATQLYPNILDSVGAFPAARNPIDRRVIEGIKDNSLPILDNEAEVGGATSMPERRLNEVVPFTGAILADAAEVARLQLFICRRHRLAMTGRSEGNACPR